jgi:hypothetical protein
MIEQIPMQTLDFLKALVKKIDRKILWYCFFGFSFKWKFLLKLLAVTNNYVVNCCDFIHIFLGNPKYLIEYLEYAVKVQLQFC